MVNTSVTTFVAATIIATARIHTFFRRPGSVTELRRQFFKARSGIHTILIPPQLTWGAETTQARDSAEQHIFAT